MKIDFKTLTMMDLRSSPGEVLDRVARDGEVFIVERNGQPKACLVPVSFLLPDIPPDRMTKELSKLDANDEPYRITITRDNEIEVSCPETAGGERFLISIFLPHGYPLAAPRIYADKIAADAPHKWPDGSLAIYGSTSNWDAKTNDVQSTLNLARQWLQQYAKWRKTKVCAEKVQA